MPSANRTNGLPPLIGRRNESQKTSKIATPELPSFLAYKPTTPTTTKADYLGIHDHWNTGRQFSKEASWVKIVALNKMSINRQQAGWALTVVMLLLGLSLASVALNREASMLKMELEVTPRSR